MWDDQALARMLDRKENEAAIFSMLMKNSKNCDFIAEIIKCICDDIIFCKEILTNNHSDHYSKPISFDAYTSRLSEIEMFDEEYLDSIRIMEPESDQKETDELIAKNNTLQSKIDELSAVVSNKNEESETLKETISTLKEEINALRNRNTELSLDLDYAKAEVKAIGDNTDKSDSYDTKESDVQSNDEDKQPVVETDECCNVESDSNSEPVKEKIVEQLPDDPYNFTETDKLAARKVRAMKEAKMDYFIDMSLTGKHVKACDDIVEFLKIDVKLCDIIDSIDLGNNSSMDKSLNEMLSIVNLDYKSPYQHFYVRSLNPQEKLCETIFNGLMEKTQRIMMIRLGE